MLINRINIYNFQGLRKAEVALTAPVALFAGPNGAGKSSLRDAIEMALTGSPSRVKLKRDYGSLVTEGNKAGSVEIFGRDVLGDFHSAFDLPSGKPTGNDTRSIKYVEYVTDTSRFARLDVDGRRQLLFELTKCDASAAAVKQALLNRGADPVRIDAVMPLLRSGFPAGCDEAKRRATEAKGAWRAVTGETYGSQKAESWKAAAAGSDTTTGTVSDGDLTAAKYAYEIADQELGESQKRLGEVSAQSGEMERLQDLASRKQRVVEKLESDRKELREWDEGIRSLKVEIERVTHTWSCPECGAVLTPEGDHLVSLTQAPAHTHDINKLRRDVASWQESHDLMVRTVINDERDLAEIEAAEKRLSEMGEKQEAAAGGLTAEVVQQQIDDWKARRADCKTKYDALLAQRGASAQSEQRTADAKKHHADIQAWTLIADALAPDGIPNDLLSAALEPVNTLLHDRCQLTGWGGSAGVRITPDMEITYNGRLYLLLSESERWRADCIIALAIAELTGLRMVILDRMDVLDLPGRGQLIMMLDDLAAAGAIDMAIVIGTLKALPKGVPGTVQTFWIEGGNIANPTAEKAAA